MGPKSERTVYPPCHKTPHIGGSTSGYAAAINSVELFLTVESEMLCSFMPEKRERPFPVDTRTSWFKAKYWNGNVWFWYCG